jgi:hypothetical protein
MAVPMHLSAKGKTNSFGSPPESWLLLQEKDFHGIRRGRAPRREKPFGPYRMIQVSPSSGPEYPACRTEINFDFIAGTAK